MEKCVMCKKPAKKVNVLIHGPSGKAVCGECGLIIGMLSAQSVESGELLSDNDKSIQRADKKSKKKKKKRLSRSAENYMNNREQVMAAFTNAKEDASAETVDSEASGDMTPKSIVDFLDRHIIGQDDAKKTLAVAVYNHVKRITDETGAIKKSNILMLGSSGCGKTLMAQTIARILNVPFAMADATSLTQAGYVGEDVETILARLLDKADGDVELAERGIIYIDEIDKIARKGEKNSSGRDVSGEGVQNALLKIIEGTEVSVPLDGNRRNPFGGTVTINTKNILFICGGAFEMITSKSEERKGAFGFGGKEETVSAEKKKVTTDDLMRYGLTHEFMGRMPVIVQLNDLKEADLVRILTEPEEALIKEYKYLLERDGVELSFDNDALSEIAKVAIKRHTGARGLRSIMEELMLDFMYEIPSKKTEENVSKFSITKELVQEKVKENVLAG